MNGPTITGKQRASRIPLDYYKHGDAMTRRKGFWTRLALGITIVWCVILIPACMIPGVNKTPLGQERYSHGPVCRVHASIGYECSACHRDFPMIGGRESASEVLSGARSTFVGDKKCLECHLGDTRNGKFDGFLAVHHPGMKVEMTPNCGTCHQDHKGLDKDLRRVADAHCTGCHKDINASLEGKKSAYGNVSSFPGDHPAFRDAKGPDPSKIKFNHAYHMTKGIVLTPGGKAWKLADMADGPQKAAMIARGVKPNVALQMDCIDCHQPDQRFNDRGWMGSAPVADVDNKEGIQKAFADRRNNRPWLDDVLSPPRTPGAYLAPIKYENHCAACHPMTVAPGVAVPHGLQPDKLQEAVASLLKEGRGQMESPKVFFSLPGKPAPAAATSKPLTSAAAMRLLMEGKRTCGECHIDAKGGDLSVSTKEIAKPDIPDIWLKHARFDHAQHELKGISCKECHPQAYPDKPRDLLDAYVLPHKGAEVMMIPGKSSCVQCHSPTPDPSYAAKGWAAKFDCTECHIYHHGMPNKK